MEIKIPDFALVLLVGPSGSGKSHFAANHFPTNQIISQQQFQLMLADDGQDPVLHDEVIKLMHQTIELRLKYKKTCVIDAELLSQESRKELRRLSRKYHAKAVSIIFRVSAQVCLDRNAQRSDGDPGSQLVKNQFGRMDRIAKDLEEEGFKSQYTVTESDETSVRRTRMRSDFRDQTGDFDIIGDVHGCFDELVLLLEELGYAVSSVASRLEEGPNFKVTAPKNRRIVFVGDLCDRGPDSPRVLRLVMDLVNAGLAFCVPGNHDDKLLRMLNGNKVQLRHGLEKTMAQLEGADPRFLEEIKQFIGGLSSHIELDGGALVVAHAGLKESMHGRSSGEVHAFCLYGETTGETDEFGLPVRHNWAGEYEGKALVVYGHTPIPEPIWQKNTVNIDTGCVFGGMLTALRYPTREIVSVKPKEMHSQPLRPLHWNNQFTAVQKIDPSISMDLVGPRALVSTRHGYHLTLQPQQVATVLQMMALEVVRREWLIYLPAPVSAPTSSQLPGTLEHPAQAFDYYRKKNLVQLATWAIPVGTSVVVVLCRNEAAAKKRFMVENDGLGSIHTRTGRPYFSNLEAERQLLQKLAKGLELMEVWDQLKTDWICLEAIASPLSDFAPDFAQLVYGPVSETANKALPIALDAVTRAQSRGVELSETASWLQNQQAAVEAFDSVRTKVEEPRSGKLTLHLTRLVATEGQVHLEKPALVMQELLRIVASAAPNWMVAVERRWIELDSEADLREVTAWWESLSGQSVTGIAVEPSTLVNEKGTELMQPMIKVRTREYLRLIYGPAYDVPESLVVWRDRNLRLQRETAVRQYSLGVEAISRFVERQSWEQVYQCIFARLGLEIMGIDIRL
ncbi:MAG: polynucleotide kinase-phosphatase [Bacteroidetes bacterium]|nr:polynucleotide kinase-phosphatase [Bacteroidota bacterium]